MIGTRKPVVEQSAVVATLFQFLHHHLRLLHGHGSVCCAMNNPERQLAQSTHVLERGSSAECHSCSNAVGIGAADIHSAITAETHAQHIHAGRVAGIMLPYPVEDIHHLLRAPCTARVLRHNGQGINIPALHDSIERTITANAREVSSAEACSMQEDNDGRLLLRIKIIYWCINPEVVASGDRIFNGSEEIVSRYLQSRQRQNDCKKDFLHIFGYSLSVNLRMPKLQIIFLNRKLFQLL